MGGCEEAKDHLFGLPMTRRNGRRIQMGLPIAKFLYVRTLDGFEYDAKPHSTLR